MLQQDTIWLLKLLSHFRVTLLLQSTIRTLHTSAIICLVVVLCGYQAHTGAGGRSFRYISTSGQIKPNLPHFLQCSPPLWGSLSILSLDSSTVMFSFFGMAFALVSPGPSCSSACWLWCLPPWVPLPLLRSVALLVFSSWILTFHHSTLTLSMFWPTALLFKFHCPYFVKSKWEPKNLWIKSSLSYQPTHVQ